MLVFSLFLWWYGRGWLAVIKNLRNMLRGISRLFSVPQLLRTLLAPWRRIISYPGASLDAKLRAYGDNIVSRAIGFVVRLIVLLTASVISFLAVIFGIVSIIAWPLVPISVVALIIKGIMT